MEKGAKGDSDDDQQQHDTRPRRPRRPRNEEPKVEESDRDRPAEGKHEKEPTLQAKQRRRRNVQEEDDQGDGGWMGGAPDVKQKFDEEPDAVDVMATQNKDKHFEEVSEIVIPDLDEDGGGESDQRVAHAPRNVSRKIPALSTLQHEAKTFLQTNKDGIDLSVLLGTLAPPNMLVEDDSLWTFESLLREVTEELYVMAKVKTAPAASTGAQKAS